MGLPAPQALSVASEVHPFDGFSVLLLQVSHQKLPDDGPSFILDLLDQPVLDLEHSPNEILVPVLPLFEFPRQSVHFYRLALVMSLTALIAIVAAAMEGWMIALSVDAESGDGPATPAPEPVLSEGEGVLCKEPFELGVAFHVFII